jgi:aspartate-semialdehyde dehydrogenase
MLRVLEERAFPIEELRVFASPRSEGRKLPFGGAEVVCEVLHDGGFDGLDFVIVDVDDPLALECAPAAAAAGAKVIDNSAAFRMDPDVPLVVAEINPEDLRSMPRGIASCPNCTTMVLVTGLAPLHRAAGLERMVVSTYQSVSGMGVAGLRELDEQWTKGAGQSERLRRAGAIDGGVESGDVWDRPIAGNVIPLAGSIREAGYTSEEMKLVDESRKILHAPDLAVSVTCVRVPVYVGHAMTANLRFRRPVTPTRRRAGGRARRRRRRPSHAPRIGGRRPGAGRSDPCGPVRARQPQPLGHGRQPPQGRRPQRRPAGRAAAVSARERDETAYSSRAFGR